MKKLKKIFKIFSIAFVLLLALVIALPFLIPIERYKPLIIEKIEENINGKVAIGKIAVRVFPFIGLKLNDVVVTNLPKSSFKGATIVKLPRFDFRVHLKSLLYFKVIASLKMDKPELYFTTLASGKSNIDDLLKPLAAGPVPLPFVSIKVGTAPAFIFFKSRGAVTEGPLIAPPALQSPSALSLGPVRPPADRGFSFQTAHAQEPEKPKTSSGSPLDELPVTIVVTAIEIDEAKVTVTDRATQEPPLVLNDLNVKITNIKLQDPSAPITFQIGTKIFGSKKENISIKGQALVDLAKKNAELKDTNLLIAGSPIHLAAKIEDYEVKQSITLSLNAPTFTFASIDAMAPAALKSLPPGASVGGSMGIKVNANGTAKNMQATGELNLLNTVIGFEPMFKKKAGQIFKVNLDALYQPTLLTIKAITLSILNDAIITSGTVGLTGNQNIELGMDSKALHIQELLSLSPANAALPVTGTPSMEINVNGSGKAPDKMNVDGNLVAKKMTYEKYVLDNLAAHFRYSGESQIANLMNLDFDMFGGHIFGAANVNLAPEKIPWSFDFRLSDIDIEQVLISVGEVRDVLTGRGGMNVVAKGIGTETVDIKKTITGNGQLSLRDGTFKSANITKGVLSPKTLGALQTGLGLVGSNITIPPALTKYTDTSFKNLEASFTIVNGLIQIPNVQLAQTDYTIAMSGTVDLDLQMNMEGNFAMSPESSSQFIRDERVRPYLVNDNAQFVMPFRITGPITNPNVEPDASFIGDAAKRAIGGVAKDQAKKLADEARQKVEQKAREEIAKQQAALQQKAAEQAKAAAGKAAQQAAQKAAQDKAAASAKDKASGAIKGLFGR
jgi:uncharacterized protein involved in outer membrane biogenesis